VPDAAQLRTVLWSQLNDRHKISANLLRDGDVRFTKSSTTLFSVNGRDALMTASEAIEKVTTQATSFFEKATEFRFFLHAFCIASYLELALYVFTSHSLYALTWKEIEAFQFGKIALGLLGYFALMGYGFRFLYTPLFACLRWLSCTRLFHQEKTRWSDLRGYVSAADIGAKCYASKDYEPLRMLEAHRKNCADNRKETKELAYLYFSAFCLAALNHFVLPSSFFTLGYENLVGGASEGIAQLVLLIFLLPWFLVWLDASDDYERDRYLNHDPIYAELKEEKQKERDKRGY
jgi:hypothetical protein